MSNYYQHPFRNFGGGQSGAPDSNSQPQYSAPDPGQGAPQSAQASGGGAGGGTADSVRDNILGLIFQGPHAKILVPVLFIGLSLAYLYIYDSVTSYSGGNPLAARAKKTRVIPEEVSDEELIDRAFESDGVGTIRPPADDGNRSVEEARSQAGILGNLFCKGLKRSRWCD